MLYLKTHQEKIRFLRDFLDGNLPNYSRDMPLMIMGSEHSGKTAVLNEILQNHTIHIVLIHNQRMEFHHATDGPSGCCAYLVEAQMWGGDFHFQEYIQTNSVVFEPDPSY